MKASKETLALVQKLGVEEQFRDHKEVKHWLSAYLKAAKKDGDEVDPDDESHELVSTIRLVCDVFAYSEDAGWLTWQSYLGPEGRGPWWVLEFYAPSRWANGKMFMRNPWMFAFSEMKAAAHNHGISFAMYSLKGKKITKEKQAWLADAVKDGLLYDYDENEFGLSWSRNEDGIYVDIN